MKDKPDRHNLEKMLALAVHADTATAERAASRERIQRNMRADKTAVVAPHMPVIDPRERATKE